MNNIPITEFDRMTIPQSIQLAKGLLAFMEYSVQQEVSKIIRIYEFLYTMDYFNKPESLRLAACSAKPHISLNSSVTDILNDEEIMNVLLCYSPDNLKSILKSFKQYNTMSDLFNQLNSNLSGLTPDQKQLYNTFRSQLDNLKI